MQFGLDCSMLGVAQGGTRTEETEGRNSEENCQVSHANYPHYKVTNMLLKGIIVSRHRGLFQAVRKPLPLRSSY